MTHETTRDAARRYLVGLLTFRELDTVAAGDGLRRIRRIHSGHIIADGGRGAHRYVVTLA